MTGKPSSPEVKAVAPDSNKRHITALDGVRGIAIVAVILHHGTVLPAVDSGSAFILRFAEFGAHGVDLFFVLSGFLITSQLFARNSDQGNLGWFYLRRSMRIIPLYYAVLCFVFLILPLALKATGFEDKLATQESYAHNWPWYAGFASNIKNALDGHFTNAALDVSWSLAIEMQFYLLWPWVVIFCQRRTLKNIIWSVIIISPILRAAAWILGANWIQILVLPIFRADTLLWGAMLAICASEPPSSSRVMTNLKNSVPWVSVLILSLVLIGAWNRQNTFTSVLGYSLFGLAAAGIIALLLTSPPNNPIRKIFEHRFFVWISIYAYGLYLIHLPVRAFLRDVIYSPEQFLQAPFPPYGGQLFFYLLAGIVALIPAVISWHLFEKPLINWGHRKTKVRSP